MTRKEAPPFPDHPDEIAPTLLVVDDDDVYRARMMQAFVERGFDVRGASTAESAALAAAQDSPELAVVDLRMPERSGLDLIRDLKAIDPATQIVVLTGYGSIETALEAVRLGATHYLTKPADADEVLAAFGRSPHAAVRDLRADLAGSHEGPTLARAEQEHIDRVLTHCNGNISQAAQLLGVHRRSLQRRLGRDKRRRPKGPSES